MKDRVYEYRCEIAKGHLGKCDECGYTFNTPDCWEMRLEAALKEYDELMELYIAKSWSLPTCDTCDKDCERQRVEYHTCGWGESQVEGEYHTITCCSDHPELKGKK